MKKNTSVKYCQPFSILREGIIFGLSAFALAFVCFDIFPPLSFLLTLFGAWSFYFFRDPVRVPPNTPHVALSPADGVILSIDTRTPPSDSKKKSSAPPMQCVSIFMNAFDVHVNRIPLHSTIDKIQHISGKFLNASLDKASELNERCIYTCTADNETFFVVQIAGMIARRIVPFCAEGESLHAGDRIGLIRFGSRVDLYLPKSYTILVKKGQRTIAGETVLAQKKEK